MDLLKGGKISWIAHVLPQDGDRRLYRPSYTVHHVPCSRRRSSAFPVPCLSGLERVRVVELAFLSNQKHSLGDP